jgi:phosphopantothenate synthetase
MDSENRARIYIVENKIVNLIRMVKWLKNAGGENAGNLHYVVENKCRKNARKRSFHYVIEK